VSAEQWGRRARRGSRRSAATVGWVAAVAAGLVFVLGAGTAVAVPPPPPKPSDSEIDASREAVQDRASQVGELTNQLAEAEGRLSDLQNQVGLKLELANKARVDAENAATAAERAQDRAAQASSQAALAAKAVDAAHKKADEFIAGSYQQGSRMGSLSAFMTSNNAQDVMLRSQLLDALSETKLDAIAELRSAQVKKSNADAAAREALQVAEAKRREAEQARQAARTAYATAVDARASQAAQARELTEDRDAVQRALYEAQQRVAGLEGQRERYQDWLAAKRKEEAQEAQQAAAAAQQQAAAAQQSSGSAAPTAPTVETIISRAMSQLGTPYAWGGGYYTGPTSGVHDWGVADSYGDYNKIGFDCSGLMMYAFAPVVSLPHYSGYQYEYGRKVPLSQAQRGDMLFWGTSGVHHVALYLGNGQMIEAMQSGTYVHVTPVRYYDIMPYAVRIVG